MANLPEFAPLPIQGRQEREHLYQWVAAEEEYVAAKFDDERNGHDEQMRNDPELDFWIRQVVQYYDRARHFLIAAKRERIGAGEEGAEYLEKKAQQAICKGMMTAKGMAESSIRVFGPLPKPGVSSGEIEPWE